MFFSKKHVKISIRNKNTTIEAKSGINLYKFLINENLMEPTLCSGSGQCGKCKVRFVGKNIPEPTGKEKLILAKISLDNGYRLACRHSVKNDIEIDTNQILSATIQANLYKNEEQTNDFSSDTLENLKDDAANIIEDILEKPKPIISAGIQTRQRPTDSHETEGPSDGIFLMQLKGKVRYFCYSAALDNIVSEGLSETSDKLTDVIDDNLISDFIHDVLKIKDIDRVLILLNQDENYKTDTLLDLIRYFKFEVGTLLCEVITPHETQNNLTRFFRLLSAEHSNKLLINIDMLDRVYFLTNNLLLDMRFDKLEQTNLTTLKKRGTNPITSFNADLNVASTEKKGIAPDGITISAFLSMVKLLLQKGIIDTRFKIKNRADLVKQGLPLEMSVRIIGKSTSEGFFLYRDRFSEIIITQAELDSLYQIKTFIKMIISYTQERIANVSGLAFYSSHNHENIMNLMIDLGFIPKEYADSISYYTGEATAHAIKLFKEKSIASYINNNFDNVKVLDLAKEPHFLEKAETIGLDIK